MSDTYKKDFRTSEDQMFLKVAPWFVLSVAVIISPSAIRAAGNPETPHLIFVTEFIRELAAIEDIRAAAEQDLKPEGPPEAVFTNMVYTSTRMQLELKVQVSRLKGMRLTKPYDEVIPDLTAFYQSKLELWAKLEQIASAIISGPKPDVDYGKLAAAMPQIRATLDAVDQAIFKATPLIFATLIDLRPDSENHVSHLIVTQAERKRLISAIDTHFGSKLDQKDQNYTVSAASVLKAYLLKDFKSADDPWD
jgi:hypothetical protein